MLFSLCLSLQMFQSTFFPENSHNLPLFVLNWPNLDLVITQWSVIYNLQIGAFEVFYVTKSPLLIRGESVSSQS